MPVITIPSIFNQPTPEPRNEVQWTPTPYCGVMIGRYPRQPQSFVAATLEALGKIASGTNGRRLMDAIVMAGVLVHTSLPYKVAILPSGDSTGLSLSRGPSFGKRIYLRGNATTASNIDRARGNRQIARRAAGNSSPVVPEPFDAAEWLDPQLSFLDGDVGSPSSIRWNPNQFSTPDGHRPPFIGLAHELIHALRNLRGDTPVMVEDDERDVTGLRLSQGNAITENAIRADHGIAPRTRYSGIQSGATTS
jgi:hypothetical protein